MSLVVDTNVPVVANGLNAGLPSQCVNACVREVAALMKDGEHKLVLDDQWRIIREYTANLRSSGQAGLGEAFLQWVLTNRMNPKRCELVRITPINEGGNDFREFPTDVELADFDPSDRKFVAVALAHQDHPAILQAIDSEWWRFRLVLRSHGVTVRFLCEEYVRAHQNET
jgi:hypothetical protein